jgi:hypothetical protein
MRERNNTCTYRIFVRESEGRRLLEIFRRRGEDTIKLNLKETACEVVDWTHVT